MTKCINGCNDPAEHNFTWLVSQGVMCANFCGICSASWWNKYKHTPAGKGVLISNVLSQKEIEQLVTTHERKHGKGTIAK